MKTDIDPDVLEPETYPLWLSKTITLPTVQPIIRALFELESAIDYKLQKIYVQYPTIGPAPVTFQDPTFRVVDNSHGKKNPFLVTYQVMSSPGRFDDLGPGLNPIGNQALSNAMSIDWMFYNTSVIELEITDYVGVGNPLTIDILILGRAYFKKNVVNT